MVEAVSKLNNFKNLELENGIFYNPYLKLLEKTELTDIGLDSIAGAVSKLKNL